MSVEGDLDVITLPPATSPPPPNATILVPPPDVGSAGDLVLWAGVLTLSFIIAFVVVALLCRRFAHRFSPEERERRRLQQLREQSLLDDKFERLRAEHEALQRRLGVIQEDEDENEDGGNGASTAAAAADRSAVHGGTASPTKGVTSAPDERRGGDDGEDNARVHAGRWRMMRAADALAFSGEAPVMVGGDSDNDSDVGRAAMCDVPVVHEHASTLLDPPEQEHTYKILGPMGGVGLRISARQSGAGGAQPNTCGDSWEHSASVRLQRADANPFRNRRVVAPPAGVGGDDSSDGGSGGGDDAVMSRKRNGPQAVQQLPFGHLLERLRRRAPRARAALIDPAGTEQRPVGAHPLPTAALPWANLFPTETPHQWQSAVEDERGFGDESAAPPFPPLERLLHSPDARIHSAAQRIGEGGRNGRGAIGALKRQGPTGDSSDDVLSEGTPQSSAGGRDHAASPRVSAQTRRLVENVLREEAAMPLPAYM